MAVSTIGVAWNTGFSEPPRFDGAGYALLARSLVEGAGYRNIDHPEAPEHDHFPPGYPMLLAALWLVTGRSILVAHVVSVLCTVGATVAAWWWFRQQYPRRVALLLGLALAMNWSWHRVGGSVRSEPAYLLIKQGTLLVALMAAKSGGGWIGGRLGLLLGALTLTRYTGAAVSGAVGLELLLRHRWKAMAATVLVSSLVVLPWAYRLSARPSQSHLDYIPIATLPEVIAENGWFYLLRMPDMLSGPFVEVGTVFEPKLAGLATGFAVVTGLVMGIGLIRSLRFERHRLAGLVLASDLALLLIWPFTEAGRFLVPLVPSMLIVAVEGLAVIGARIGLRRPRTGAAALLLIAAVPYATYAAISGRAAAERHLQGVVDPALRWLAQQEDRPGPIMTAYPAEAHWQTDRLGVEPPEGSEAIAREIDRFDVAFLLVTEARFANAAGDPLARFAAERPDLVRLAWADPSGRIRVYEVMRRPGRLEP